MRSLKSSELKNKSVLQLPQEKLAKQKAIWYINGRLKLTILLVKYPNKNNLWGEDFGAKMINKTFNLQDIFASWLCSRNFLVPTRSDCCPDRPYQVQSGATITKSINKWIRLGNIGGMRAISWKSTETHLIRFQIKARANLFQLHRLRATTFFIDMVPAKNIYLYICMVKDFPLTKVSNLINGLLRGPFTIRLRYSEFTYGIEHLCHNIHRNKKLSRSEATWSGRDNLKIS